MIKHLLVLLLLMMYSFPSFAEGTPTPFLEEGAEPILTDFSYQSENVVIDITSMRVYESDVYIADIHVRSVACFQRAFAGGEWGKETRKISTIAEASGALLAMTGDSGQNFSAGWIVGNGIVERSTRNRKRDLCLVLKDGSMTFYPAGTITQEQLEATAAEIWHCFLFGPVLLDSEGTALNDFSASNVRYQNPRSALGYYEPGHYCLILIDGRQPGYSMGMTFQEMSFMFKEMGCTAAYNMDGGQSAKMVFGDKLVNRPTKGGRDTSDIIFIAETEDTKR